jgi:hypothetical protein
MRPPRLMQLPANIFLSKSTAASQAKINCRPGLHITTQRAYGNGGKVSERYVIKRVYMRQAVQRGVQMPINLTLSKSSDQMDAIGNSFDNNAQCSHATSIRHNHQTMDS